MPDWGMGGEERTWSCNKLSEVKESESKCSNKVLAAFCLFKIHNFKASLRASGTTVRVMGCSPNKPVPVFLMCLYVQSQE